MRARVPQTLLNRIARCEAIKNTKCPDAEWPNMLSVDEWEAIAVPSQAALVAFTREYVLGADYRDGPIEPDPMDVTHKYKPSRHIPEQV